MTKKVTKWTSIGLLICGLSISIFITEYNNPAQVIVLISIALGTLGSILSVFIPSTSTIEINEDSWNDNSEGGFSAFIQANRHGQGKNPSITTYMYSTEGYVIAICGAKIDAQGNIEITARKRYKLKALIS